MLKLKEARTRALKGKPGYRDVVDYFDSDSIEGKMRYLIAVGLAIRESSLDPEIRADDVRDAISTIPASFRRQERPKLDPWLRKYTEGQLLPEEVPFAG